MSTNSLVTAVQLLPNLKSGLSMCEVNSKINSVNTNYTPINSHLSLLFIRHLS